MTFEVGDRVRVRSDVDEGLRPGAVGTVSFLGKAGGSYPVTVSFGGGDVESYALDELTLVGSRGRKLTVKQGGSTTTFEGDFEFEVEDLDAYVQVSFNGQKYGQRYTYRDPSGTLQVGDRVIVPVGTSLTKENAAQVMALGRGSWKGHVKDVTARLTREELVAA